MLNKYGRVSAAVLALSVLASAPACGMRVVAVRVDMRAPIQQRAYNEGHRKGFDRGRADARRGRATDPDRFREYRNADSGYRRGEGDRETYRDSYRQGFRAGYAEAFGQRRETDDRDRGRRR